MNGEGTCILYRKSQEIPSIITVSGLLSIEEQEIFPSRGAAPFQGTDQTVVISLNLSVEFLVVSAVTLYQPTHVIPFES